MAAYTTIDNPELYFQCKIYTGNGSATHAITFDGDEDMQPDLVWIKNRSSAENHALVDSVRGVGKQLLANATAGEYSNANSVKAFNSNGFSVGDLSDTNGNTNNLVAWCWKAGTSFSNDASATSVGNTDSSGSASSTAGFSISKYTGVGASLDIVVKHGLSAAPAMMWTKNLDDANNWGVYHHKNTSAPETDYLRLDTNAATTDDAEMWADTAPTSAVFTAGDHSSSNRAGDDFVSYFWNEVQGYSAMGSYTGNGNASGAVVWCGFTPAFVLIKSAASGVWRLWDNKRDSLNPNTANFQTNAADAEYDHSSVAIDFLSSGFKARSTDSSYNGSGTSYVYMAFAEAPFVNSNGVPANAR